MRRRISTGIVATAALALVTACNPIQVERAISSRGPQVPTDTVMRYRCGTRFPFEVNTAGYADLSPADRKHCVTIRPHQL